MTSVDIAETKNASLPVSFSSQNFSGEFSCECDFLEFEEV